MLAKFTPVALSRRTRVFIIASSILLFIFLVLYYSDASWFTEVPGPTNSTLGFGAIYVLAQEHNTWRVQGLLQAAKLAGLQLTIPLRTRPSDEAVFQYLEHQEAATFLNEIRAVINYISLIDTFIASGHETALFLEDDVDFHVSIKAQMQILSHVMLGYDGQDETLDGHPRHSEASLYPYGKDSWDVLWIGCYGVEEVPTSETTLYDDPFALPWEQLTSNFNNYFDIIRERQKESGKDEPQRFVEPAAPIGSYAFALTRSNAERVVRMLRDQHVQRFDLALHLDCKSSSQKCVAPVPSLMHHHRVVGQASIAEVSSQDDGVHELDWWRHQHKYTYNIEWSARCNAAKVGENVGDRWQCMPGRYDFDE